MSEQNTTPTANFDFQFPESLIATEPSYPPRVLRSLRAADASPAQEISWSQFLNEFQAGDLLIRNSSKVVPRRIFANGLEILFLRLLNKNQWEVLYPAKKNKIGDTLALPGGITARLVQKGLPQILEVSEALEAAYFFQYGELPLPPYIQAARSNRHHVPKDQFWYQTCFAKKEGSLAAPTAGLHFKEADFDFLVKKGVEIIDVTLHVGLGTFLPIQTETIEDFKIHSESFEVSRTDYEKIKKAHEAGGRIITLGTTSTRVTETLARIPKDYDFQKDFASHHFKFSVHENQIFGETQIYLNRTSDFLWVNGILTNFHQPQTSLLVMICAFAGYDHVMSSYRHAVSSKFRLFSYGDFSVWNR